MLLDSSFVLPGNMRRLCDQWVRLDSRPPQLNTPPRKIQLPCSCHTQHTRVRPPHNQQCMARLSSTCRACITTAPTHPGIVLYHIHTPEVQPDAPLNLHSTRPQQHSWTDPGCTGALSRACFLLLFCTHLVDLRELPKGPNCDHSASPPSRQPGTKTHTPHSTHCTRPPLLSTHKPPTRPHRNVHHCATINTTPSATGLTGPAVVALQGARMMVVQQLQPAAQEPSASGAAASNSSISSNRFSNSSRCWPFRPSAGCQGCWSPQRQRWRLHPGQRRPPPGQPPGRCCHRAPGTPGQQRPRRPAGRLC